MNTNPQLIMRIIQKQKKGSRKLEPLISFCVATNA